MGVKSSVAALFFVIPALVSCEGPCARLPLGGRPVLPGSDLFETGNAAGVVIGLDEVVLSYRVEGGQPVFVSARRTLF